MILPIRATMSRQWSKKTRLDLGIAFVRMSASGDVGLVVIDSEQGFDPVLAERLGVKLEANRGR